MKASSLAGEPTAWTGPGSQWIGGRR